MVVKRGYAVKRGGQPHTLDLKETAEEAMNDYINRYGSPFFVPKKEAIQKYILYWEVTYAQIQPE